MASIDKIYGTKDQYEYFYSWCYENKKDALKYFYPWDTDDEYSHVICLFPEEIDKWMWNNCRVYWVVKQIEEQYGQDVTCLYE